MHSKILAFLLASVLAGCIGNDSVDVDRSPVEIYLIPPPIYVPEPLPLIHPNPARRKTA